MASKSRDARSCDLVPLNHLCFTSSVLAAWARMVT